MGFGGRRGVNVPPGSRHSLSEQSPSVSPACRGARAGDRAPGAAFTLYEALLDLLSLCFGPVPGCVESMLITKKKKKKKVTCVLISTLPFNYRGWKQLQNYEAMAVNFSFET